MVPEQMLAHSGASPAGGPQAQWDAATLTTSFPAFPAQEGPQGATGSFEHVSGLTY